MARRPTQTAMQGATSRRSLASRMRSRVEIHGNTITEDAFGGEVRAWAKIADRYAQVIYGDGEERRIAAQEGASMAATFIMRLDPVTSAMKPKDRQIEYDGATWDIGSVVKWRDRGEVHVTAVAAQ